MPGLDEKFSPTVFFMADKFTASGLNMDISNNVHGLVARHNRKTDVASDDGAAHHLLMKC